MADFQKPNYSSIAGTIISILLCVIGYFLSGVYQELKEVRTILTSILVVNGGLTKEVETLKTDQQQLRTQVREHDNQVLKFYQDYYDKNKK